MKPYPVEFRHRVLALTDEGRTTAEIAAVLGTSRAWVRSIKALHKAGAAIEPRSRANKRTSLAQREGDRIRAHIAAKPSTTLEELKRDLGLNTTIPNLWLALQQLKIHLKKKRSTPPSGPARMSSPTARSGRSSRRASTPAASFSSTKRSARRP
jgi:transposase